jgi:hypothetical protein
MIDLNKPLQTRDGRRVTITRILPIDVSFGWPIHGFIHGPSGKKAARWRSTGGGRDQTIETPRDLINVPERKAVRPKAPPALHQKEPEEGLSVADRHMLLLALRSHRLFLEDRAQAAEAWAAQNRRWASSGASKNLARCDRMIADLQASFAR